MNKKTAVAIIFNQALTKTVLVMKKRPDFLKNTLNPAGGGLEEEDGHQSIKTAFRELKEETGLCPDQLYHVGTIIRRQEEAECEVYAGLVGSGAVVKSPSGDNAEEARWYDYDHLSDFRVNEDFMVFIPFAKAAFKKGVTEQGFKSKLTLEHA